MTTRVLVVLPQPNHNDVDVSVQDSPDAVNWTSKRSVGVLNKDRNLIEVYVHEHARIVVEELPKKS